MDNFLVASALKGAQWERTKGELRAMVALQGSYSTGSPPGVVSPVTERWQKLSKCVEEFIKIVEDNGLHQRA